jgi:hypothetical protein
LGPRSGVGCMGLLDGGRRPSRSRDVLFLLSFGRRPLSRFNVEIALCLLFGIGKAFMPRIAMICRIV